MRPSRTLAPLFALLLLVACPSFAFAQGGGACCLLPDNGNGSAALPPDCPTGYNGPGQIADGLPVGSPLVVAAKLRSFFNVVSSPGGSLGGEVQTWNATLDLTLTGTGVYLGYLKTIPIPVTGTTHSAPRTPFAPVQTFAMTLWGMQGQVFTDPDFDLLRVTAGDNFGLPSPGQTTLTAAGASWAVDSFFDITYRVDFVGDPGGPFAGRSGSTTNLAKRFDMCHEDPTPAQPVTWGAMKALYR